ncbi:MAG: peroxiredoxin [Candidatus Wallbacteria bacterium]|nr:peroxiredoxin [Candidatus Wallbacteria bacterium]
MRSLSALIFVSCLSFALPLSSPRLSAEPKEETRSLLAAGSLAPGFEARSDAGAAVRLADFAGKKNVILYFYPKDDTPGCTKEACGFRDALAGFDTKDTVILGVSLDDEKSHAAFKAKFHLNFTLLADPKGEICKSYGVAVRDGAYAERVTFVIGKDGAVKKVFPKVRPEEHSKEVLEALK